MTAGNLGQLGLGTKTTQTREYLSQGRHEAIMIHLSATMAITGCIFGCPSLFREATRTNSTNYIRHYVVLWYSLVHM